jgi:hypothetical protein
MKKSIKIIEQKQITQIREKSLDFYERLKRTQLNKKWIEEEERIKMEKIEREFEYKRLKADQNKSKMETLRIEELK